MTDREKLLAAVLALLADADAETLRFVYVFLIR